MLAVRDENNGIILLADNNARFVGKASIEVGALSEFFSSELATNVGENQAIYRTIHREDEVYWQFAATPMLSGAEVQIVEQGKMSRECGERRLTVEATAESLLMDTVLRFVLPLDLIDEVSIGKEIISHRSKNFYHQRSMQSVSVRLVTGATLQFRPLPAVLPLGMAPVVYLRDEAGQWILHFRALAMNPDVTVFKGCHRWFNRPFPKWLQLPVREWSWLRQQLLYVRERVSQRIPVQVNGAVRLKKGECVQLGVAWRWS